MDNAKHPWRVTAAKVVLRYMGVMELLALIAVLMPFEWSAAGHRWLGLGDLPRLPLLDYLIRSASALYALHGAIMLFLSFDIPRYAPLIRFLAWAALVHGAIILGIDLHAGLPWFWIAVEPFGYVIPGLLLLIFVRNHAVAQISR